MKFLVLFACALAAASAGHIVAPLATVYTSQAQHLPVIGADGVPVDTAEVQHARAAHAIHKVDAQIRNGDVAVVAHPAPIVAAHVAPVATAYSAHVAPYAAYPTTAVLPAALNGVPLETPEVVAAKSHHFAAHAEALARNGHLAVLYRRRRGIYAYSSPLLASAYAHHTPLVATTYAHQTPVLATSYAHHTPLVASTYAGHYGYPYGYAAHYY